MQKITKENIAMDLHDEVGTMLTRVLYLMKLESKETKMVSYLSDALFSLRVYINTMNKSYFKIEQLLDELNELAVNILGEEMVNIKITNNQQYILEINSDLFRDIKLCIYEVLNNIQKHAGASEVNLEFTIIESIFNIRIIDNGCYSITLQKKSNGNGIENIKKRVARNQGIVTFEQNPLGTGLQVSISIPLK
jgi:signal transduction histidine kinase